MTTRHEYATRDDALAAVNSVSEVAHEIAYWLPKRVTMDQWIALDDGFERVLSEVLGDTEEVFGIAGPIPFEEDA